MCPHRSRKLDLGTGAGAVERAGEIGDKDPRTLEHADDDEIGRKCPGDLRGESIDPSGDLRCAKQNAQSALCAAEPARPRSVEADAAVDVDCLAGNEAAVVADQEQAGRGDLVDMPRLLSLWRQGRLKLDHLISGKLKLEQINDGFAALKSGAPVRQLIEFAA